MMYEEEEEDAFMAQNESLEAEFLGSNNSLGASLGQSLAFELQSATLPEVSKSTQSQRRSKSPAPPTLNGTSSASPQVEEGPLEIELEVNGVKMEGFGAASKQVQLPIGVLHSLSDEIFTNSASPSPSPSTSAKTLLHQNGSGLEELGDSASLQSQAQGDTVEFLKIHLDHLNAAVTETKTLHKRIIDSLLSDESLQLSRSAATLSTDSSSFAPPLELVVSSVANLMDRKARDRERHLNILCSIDKTIRADGIWLPPDVLDDLDAHLLTMVEAMTDPNMTFTNPLPTIRQLHVENASLSDTLEDLKEQMYVHKKQGQELSTRMRIISKAVHEVRKELRELSEQVGMSSDEDDVVVLQEGEVRVRVGEILSGLDELDQRSSQDIQKMMGWWKGEGSMAVGVTS